MVVQPLRIFVSSELELTEERKVAEQAIQELTQEPRLSEKFPSHPQEPMVICSKEVSESDMLILILGDKITYPVKEEHDTACTKGIDVFVFIKDCQRDKETCDFIESIKSRHFYGKPFEKLSKEMVKEAIMYRVIEKYRAKLKMPGEFEIKEDMQGRNRPREILAKVKVGTVVSVEIIHGDCHLVGNDRAEHWVVKLDKNKKETHVGNIGEYGMIRVKGSCVDYDKIAAGRDPYHFNFVPNEAGDYLIVSEMGCCGGGGKRLVVHLLVSKQ